MRILGMISSPRGLPALDVDGEKERLEEALRPHLDSGRVELEWLDDVTWNARARQAARARNGTCCTSSATAPTTGHG